MNIAAFLGRKWNVVHSEDRSYNLYILSDRGDTSGL